MSTIPKQFTGRPGTAIRWPDATDQGTNQLTADQVAALAGTAGHPNASNRYVTNQDLRLSDNRYPLLHAATHARGGLDGLRLDSFNDPIDITNGNATTFAHGLCPKLPGSGALFLDGTGGWSPSGGFTPPTGTGFAHITAGVLDVAAQLVFNADVDPAAAIAESKLSLNYATHPKLHAANHGPAPAIDPLKLDDLEVPDDNTDLNATKNYHGLLPKLSDSVTDFLTGKGTWAVPAGTGMFVPTGTGIPHIVAGVEQAAATLIINDDVHATAAIVESKLSLNYATHPKLHAADHGPAPAVDPLKLDDLEVPDDNTDLNATKNYHGLLPKLSDSVTDFLTGKGTWAVPAGTGMFVPTGTGVPKIVAGVEQAAAALIDNVDVAVAAAIVESKLSLNYPTHSNANDPSSGEKAALAGTSGVPGVGNKYVTDGDSRNSNARTPTAHASTHGPAPATDPLKLDDLEVPDNNTDLNATAGRHGLLPMLSGAATDFLSGAGTWLVPAAVTPSATNFIIIGGASTAAGNGTLLTNAYAAAKAGALPFGGALSATNRYTIFLLPGTYSCNLTMDTQFIDLMGIAGDMTSSIVTSATKTITLTADDVIIANLTIECTAAGNAANNTGDFGFYPSSGLANNKLVRVGFRAATIAQNRCMRMGVNYNGFYVDCVCSGVNGFGCAITGASTDNAGTFVRCVGNAVCFGSSSTNGVTGTVSGTCIDCTAVQGGFAGASTASGLFYRCQVVASAQTQLGLLNTAAPYGAFGGGGTITNNVIASGQFWYCTSYYSNAFGATNAGGTGVFSGTAWHCSMKNNSYGFGSSGFSGKCYWCDGGTQCFAYGTSVSFSGECYYCRSGSNSFAGGGGSFTAAAVLVGCVATTDSYGGRNGWPGGTFAGVAIGCIGGDRCFCCDVAGGTHGTISGRLTLCKWTGTFNANVTGSVVLCDAPTYNSYITGGTAPTADQYGFYARIQTANTGANALGTQGLVGEVVQNTVQNLTFDTSGQNYASAGLLGVKGTLLATGNATVTSAMGVGSQILARTTTTISQAYGFFATLFNDVGNATVTTYYSYYAKAPTTSAVLTMTTHYGLYLESTASTGWTKWGVYQADLGAKNLFAGQVQHGTASGAAYGQLIDSAFAYTTQDTTKIFAYFAPTWTPTADTANGFQGLLLQATSGGAKTLTGTVYGINLQALHGGTGTLTYLVGGAFIARKYSTGTVTDARGGQFQIVNANATNKITAGYTAYLDSPNLAATGFMDQCCGLYINTQKVTNVTTGYGIYQVGTSDLNCLLGITGLGIAASTSAWAVFAAATTGIASYRVTTGVKPTSPVDGDTWYDSTQKCDAFWRNALLQYQVTCIWNQTASVTIANSNVEATLLSATGVGGKTLPANFFVAGKEIRMRLAGIIKTNGGAQTGRARIMAGATALIDTGAVTLGNVAADDSWEMNVTIVCRSTGAPGTVVPDYDFYYHTAGGGGTSGPNEIDVNPAVVNLTTTGSLALDVLWTWGAAHANNTITCLCATFEVLS